MKPFASAVRPELTSLPGEVPLLIQNIKGGRASQPSKDCSTSPGSGGNTHGKCNVFSSGLKYSNSPSHSSNVKSHNVSSMGPFLPLLAKDSSAMTNCTLDNNVFDNDTSGRHFLFDERWRNGVYITSAFGASSNRIVSTSQQDDVLIKQNSSMLLPYPEFHVYRSHNFTRFAHRKEFSLGNPKPLVFGADYLTSFPSVLLPATTPSVGEGLCLSRNYKNRSRVKYKACNCDDAKNKFHSYPDPLLGATSTFVQRMTEISFLEAETVRQEKIRKLKKINRQDS